MSARTSSNQPFWTQEQCFRALYTWVREHGYVPSENGDWRHMGPNHPSGRSCRRIFGSWSRFILMAGLDVRTAGMPAYWTRDSIAEWLLDELARRGEWPIVTELRVATEERRPSYCTVLRVFGSYTKAKKFAGWNARCRECHGPLGRSARASQMYCSEVCARRGRRARSATRSLGGWASARALTAPGGADFATSERGAA